MRASTNSVGAFLVIKKSQQKVPKDVDKVFVRGYYVDMEQNVGTFGT